VRQAIIDEYRLGDDYVEQNIHRSMPGSWWRDFDGLPLAFSHNRELGDLEERDREGLERMGIDVEEGTWADVAEPN